jgi:hypothetical protein
MAAWEMPVGIVLVIFGGVSLALQSGVNASLGSHITKPLACECQTPCFCLRPWQRVWTSALRSGIESDIACTRSLF